MNDHSWVIAARTTWVWAQRAHIDTFIFYFFLAGEGGSGVQKSFSQKILLVDIRSTFSGNFGVVRGW